MKNRMIKMAKRFLGTGLLVLVWSTGAWGVEIIKDTLWIETYLRTTNLVGDGFNEGADPSLGADFGLTLFQRSYFESATRYREKKLQIVAQLAIDNQQGFFVSAGDGSMTPLQMKDFYAEFFDVGATGNSLWVGARKYQILDEHNLFGLGYRMTLAPGLRMGIAQGMRRDFGYWGAKSVADNAFVNFDLSSTEHPPSFRSTTILDFEKMLNDNSNVKLLAEYQRIGAITITGSWTDSTGKAQSAKYNLGSVSGYLTGIEYNRWGTQWNHSSSFIYGNGDVAGSPLSKINTRGSAAQITDILGMNPLSIEQYKGDNKRMTTSHSGARMSDKYSYSYLFAAAYDRMARINDRSMFLINVRPFYHLERSLHLGIDASRTSNLQGIDRPGYTVLAPILRYAMNQDNYGKPYLQLFYGYAVYDYEYVIYGSPQKTMGVGGIQFEAFF